MADVALSVAVITGLTGILAASIPLTATIITEGRRASRDRRDRDERDVREACLDILSAAGGLRTLVGSAPQLRGEEMNARLAEISAAVATVQRYAVGVALLGPWLDERAQDLATAAARLAAATEKNTDKVARQMVRPPDFSELDQAVAAFRSAAVEARKRTARTDPGPG